MSTQLTKLDRLFKLIKDQPRHRLEEASPELVDVLSNLAETHDLDAVEQECDRLREVLLQNARELADGYAFHE